MTLTVLNDIHIGTIRGAGTTPATQLELRQFIIDEFLRLLPDTDLMILGDLFDKESIPITDLLKTYRGLFEWLKKGHKLWLVAGNHDLSKTSNVMSSFGFLGALLTDASKQVKVVTTPTLTPYGYVIPHLPNQDLFDIALDNVPECENLFLHCNYDNNFAAQLDQSLNLSAEQARKLPVKRNIFIAHEHHKRITGKVVLPGNQIPSSCADLAPDADKYFLRVSGSNLMYDNEKTYSLVRCNVRAQLYTAATLEDMGKADTKFVRVGGTVDAEKAGSALTALNRLRATSKALVITNGIEVLKDNQAMELTSSGAELQAFDVWAALTRLLTPQEIEILKGLA